MNRIDIETYIHKAWQTSEDLDALLYHYGDHHTPMTEDEVANALLGIKMMHEIRMERLFDVFKRHFQLDEYTTDPEVLAVRARVYGELHGEEKSAKKKGKKNVQKA